MVEVKRKRNESFDGLLRRFNRRLIQSGRLLQAKKIRFYKIKPNKTKRRASAHRRAELQKERSYLEKIGKLTPDTFRSRSGRR